MPMTKKATKKALKERAAEIAKVLEVIGDNAALPTSIRIDFQYKRNGEQPEHINYLMHLASAMNMVVVEGHGHLLFRLGEG